MLICIFIYMLVVLSTVISNKKFFVSNTDYNLQINKKELQLIFLLFYCFFMIFCISF